MTLGEFVENLGAGAEVSKAHTNCPAQSSAKRASATDRRNQKNAVPFGTAFSRINSGY